MTRCSNRASILTAASRPRISRSNIERVRPWRSLKTPSREAKGPSHTLTLSPLSSTIESRGIKPVAGSIRTFSPAMIDSGILISSMPARTRPVTPRVERTTSRLWRCGSAFRNKYRGNSGSPVSRPILLWKQRLMPCLVPCTAALIRAFRHGQITLERLPFKIKQRYIFLPWLGIDCKPVCGTNAQNISCDSRLFCIVSSIKSQYGHGGKNWTPWRNLRHNPTHLLIIFWLLLIGTDANFT